MREAKSMPYLGDGDFLRQQRHNLQQEKKL
jgi:hypothetical protein